MEHTAASMCVINKKTNICHESLTLIFFVAVIMIKKKKKSYYCFLIMDLDPT